MPLNESDIAHLLHRTEFVATEEKIAALIKLPTREAAVDAILGRNIFTTAKTNIMGAKVNNTVFGTTVATSQAGVNDARQWWLDQMAFGPTPLKEKMTFFWHGHFTSDAEGPLDLINVAEQNQLYRDNAFGNIREFAYLVSTQPLMLQYLDNVRNTRWHPNENFARELLELFLLGLNTYETPGLETTYTQEDVIANAKAWTGHSINYSQAHKKYQYYPDYHWDADKRPKENPPATFLGKTQSWTGRQIVDHIFDTEPYRMISCKFIAEKLWSFLAYPEPEKEVLDAIVAKFHQTLSIGDLLRAILVHPNFYSPHAKEGLISTPVEHVVRLLAATGSRAGTPNMTRVVSGMPETGQRLFHPPNVAGWKQNEYWLSTSTMGARGNISAYLANTQKAQQMFADLDLDKGDYATIINAAMRRLGMTSMLPASRFAIMVWLMYERKRASSTIAFKSSGLFHLLTMSPDFQIQ